MLAPALVFAQAEPAEVTYDRKKYENAMVELKSAATETDRFYALNDAAKTSLSQGHDADAKSFAEELEKLTPKYKGDWNYGNAIQDFNLVLGRLALKAGEVENAKKRLLAAGRSPGSPQMNTFGPNMTLARDLLAKGEKEVVLAYFDLCKNFWKMEDGRLAKWRQDIAADRSPDFGANLIY
ncbi:MAG: hypothetical protein ABIR29_12295 [Chthoniobacterales bacterium]